MHTILHPFFTIWYLHWFSIQFSWICTFNEFEFFSKSELSVRLLYIIFHWIFMILYYQRNQISQQSRTICTSYVHNFSLNFHDLVCSLIFHQIFTNLYNQRIRIFLQIPMIYTLLYKIFHWIFTTLYYQQNQISKQVRTICISYVYNFPLNFYDLVHSSVFLWIFTILHI